MISFNIFKAEVGSILQIRARFLESFLSSRQKLHI